MQLKKGIWCFLDVVHKHYAAVWQDHGHTLLVFVVWGFVTVAGVRVATWAYSGSLTFGLVWFVVAVLLMLFAYGGSELLRQSHRLASAKSSEADVSSAPHTLGGTPGPPQVPELAHENDN